MYERETPCGRIKGIQAIPGVEAYLGIRYAKADRWQYPEEVTLWEGTYDAQNYGPASYQPRAFVCEGDLPGKNFYYNEFRKGTDFTYGDDCLMLNIWIPEGTEAGAGLPVLFYIHGGAFVGGAGNEKQYNGRFLAKKGIIAITINYRLGPMGFLALPELEEEAGHTGNYGLFDQLCALSFVRRNIEAFGGDPEKITIMGQSAGAMSVQKLCTTKLSDGMFRSAVMSSGCGLGIDPNSAPKVQDFYPFWKGVMKNAGCENLAELRKIPADKLFAAWNKTSAEMPEGRPAIFPSIDGVYVTEPDTDTIAAHGMKQVPYLIGHNSEDIVVEVLQKGLRNWCAMTESPVHAYFFNRPLPGDNAGAWHSADLWYWFATLENCWRPFEDKDREIADMMSAALVNFVRTGDPNGEGVPAWEQMNTETEESMIIGVGEYRMESVDLAAMAEAQKKSTAQGE